MPVSGPLRGEDNELEFAVFMVVQGQQLNTVLVTGATGRTGTVGRRGPQCRSLWAATVAMQRSEVNTEQTPAKKANHAGVFLGPCLFSLRLHINRQQYAAPPWPTVSFAPPLPRQPRGEGAAGEVLDRQGACPGAQQAEGRRSSPHAGQQVSVQAFFCVACATELAFFAKHRAPERTAVCLLQKGVLLGIETPCCI